MQNDSAALVVTENKNENICGVIVKSGKNKGLPCTNSSSCRIHVHLRKGSGNVAAVASPQLN